MAVNIETGNTKQAKANNAKGGNKTSLTFGIGNRMGLLGSGGETFEKLYTSISHIVDELQKDPSSNSDLKVLKLMKGRHGLNYSGIVVTDTYGDHTSAHVLMVERTGDYPEKWVENVGGVRYDIVRTPADALDDKYVSEVVEFVKTSLRTDNVTLVDGTLVPSEFDVNSEAQVGDLVNNTLNSLIAENAIRVDGYKGVNLAEFIAQNPQGKFLVNTYFNGDKTQYFDQSGMPVRQDICIALSFKNSKGTNSRSVNQGDDTQELVRTYGYMDFEYVGPQMNNVGPMSQQFVPNFVITHIEAGVAPTTDILLLGVVSALSLNEEMSWMQSFRPTPARKGEMDLNDIGALNIEGNLEASPTGFGKKYNTKSKEFTIGELNSLVNNLVRPYMIVSIDIPKAGPETWYTSVFRHAKGNISSRAFARVQEAVGTLTNGTFVPQTNIFMDASNKIHGGFYKTKDGFEDIRHLGSYLSVANYVSETAQSQELINQYTSTLYNTAMPEELRAAERGKMIQDMAGNTAVVKQMFDRLTFNGQFLGALAASLRGVGFTPMFANMGHANDMFQRRSTLAMDQAYLDPSVRIMGQSNLFGNGSIGWNSFYQRGF